MSKYIRLEDAIKMVDEKPDMTPDEKAGVIARLLAVPAADVRLAKQGHWIKRMEEKVIDGAEIYEPSWFCSECGEEYDPQDCRRINFCFVCGADLREHHGG